jgi:hypothetical protein
MYLETTGSKLTRPSGSGNLAQTLTGHANLGFALDGRSGGQACFSLIIRIQTFEVNRDA